MPTVARTDYSPLQALFSIWPNLRRANGNALSVYLPARAEGYDARYYDIVFGDLRHRYRERLGAKELEVMRHELPRLRSHIAELRPAGAAALAGFSETSAGLLELVRLPSRTEERLDVGELLLAPALRQLEQFPPSFVAVVDSRQVLTFASVLDELRPAGAHRGPSALEAAVEEVEQAMSGGTYRRIYLAGPLEARAQLERSLPNAMRKECAHLANVSTGSTHIDADIRRELRLLRATAVG